MDKGMAYLLDIGLTATEARLYLAGGGALSAHDRAKTAGIRRTTAYHALETLCEKGLASRSEQDGKTKFSLSHPHAIAAYLRVRQAEVDAHLATLEELAPLLHGMAPADGSVARVTRFSGATAMKAAVEEALYCRQRTWDIIAPGNNFFSQAGAAYGAYFMETRRRREITARSLWEYNPVRRMLSPGELAQRNPRFLPDALRGMFTSTILIFDDKVLFLTSKKAGTALLLHSDEVSRTMRTLFEGLWTAARPYLIAKGKD